MMQVTVIIDVTDVQIVIAVCVELHLIVPKENDGRAVSINFTVCAGQ